MGRRTFVDLRGYWPKQTDDPTGITDYLNRVQKYVVSSTLTDPEWENSTVLAGDPVKEVRALKQQPGQDIVVTGSITLCHTLIEAGLVDEYRLFVYPVVQGRGRRLFPDGFECAAPAGSSTPRPSEAASRDSRYAAGSSRSAAAKQRMLRVPGARRPRRSATSRGARARACERCPGRA